MTDAAPVPQSGRHDPVLRPLETFTALCVAAVLAVLLAALAFTRSTQATEQRGLEYGQSASLSYAAATDADSIYGASGLETGQTVVLEQVDDLDVRIEYSFTTPERAADLAGTARLEATVVVGGGLRRTFTMSEAAFDGPTGVLEGTLRLDALSDYLARARTLLGDAGASATAAVTVQPVVEIEGTLDGRALSTAFSPEFPFVLGDDTLAVASETGEPAGGDSDVLNPSTSAELAYSVTVPATLDLVVLDPSITSLRWVSLLLALGCAAALLVLGRKLFARSDKAAEVERIIAMHGSRLVTVARLDLRDSPVANVSSFEDLVDLAKRYESAIMHVRTGGTDEFWVWDTGLAYRYEARPAAVTPATTSASAMDRTGRRRSAEEHAQPTEQALDDGARPGSHGSRRPDRDSGAPKVRMTV